MTLFAFDPVGNLNANRIQNEPQTISAINGIDHNYIVPTNAPFYNQSLTVTDVTTGAQLYNGTDFYFAYDFIEASTKTGEAISGAIVFVDPNRNGSYLLSYQTLGGEYVDNATQAIANGLASAAAVASLNWSDIANLPSGFPPTPHETTLSNVVGVADVIAEIQNLGLVLNSPDRRITMSDIADIHPEYITPLLDGMNAIVIAIDTLASNNNVYSMSRNTGSNVINILPGVINQWLPIPTVDITIAVAGTYSITPSGNPLITTNGAVPIVNFRFTVNGASISQSTIAGSTIGLSVGDVVGLQMQVNYALATSIQVAGNGIACGLTLIKVGI